MIRIHLKRKKTLKQIHWRWFLGILNDSKDWYVSSQSNAVQSRVMTRKDFILSMLNLKSIRQLKHVVLANYKSMKKIIGKHPEWVCKNPKCAFTKEDKDALLEAFGYNSKFHSEKGWGAYQFYKWADVKVCPYCNSQSIGVGMCEEDNTKVKDQIDHFFPEAIYPFLSITLFNMVPSCLICNKNKLSYDTYKNDFVYPYKTEYGNDGKFFLRYSFDKMFDKNFCKSLKDDLVFHIKKSDGTNVNRKDIKNSKEKLKIVSEYNAHGQDEAKNLILKCQSECKAHVEMLQKMGFPREQILRELNPAAIMQKSEYPYRKMKEDILDQIEGYMEKSPVYISKKCCFDVLWECIKKSLPFF